MDNITFRELMEKVDAVNKPDVEYIKLPATVSQIKIFSKENIDLHYGTLYKNYVKKALAGEGEFQIDGAKLHKIYFEQFQACDTSDKPTGAVKELIDKKYGSYTKFKEAFKEVVMSIHGSGWAFMDKTGKIKVIHNHDYVDGIVFLCDIWEHAMIDYNLDRTEYLKNFWTIVNWNMVNERL